MSDPLPTLESARPLDFIREIVTNDLRAGRHSGRVHTRFPPEPNGYLHIGHAKSICLNFGVAEEFAGLCNLRFDDTNPTKEDLEYVESIQEDVRWLGFDWADRMFYASDYFEQLYQFAEQLIREHVIWSYGHSGNQGDRNYLRIYSLGVTGIGAFDPLDDEDPSSRIQPGSSLE